MDGERQPYEDILYSNIARVDTRRLISFLESGQKYCCGNYHCPVHFIGFISLARVFNGFFQLLAAAINSPTFFAMISLIISASALGVMYAQECLRSFLALLHSNSLLGTTIRITVRDLPVN